MGKVISLFENLLGSGPVAPRDIAADDFDPVPAGKYKARIIDGNLTESAGGTPTYKVTFEITEGEHAGRWLWYDIWLTEGAHRYAKRDLEKLGITSEGQLSDPLTRGYLCEVRGVVRRDDDGNEWSREKWFRVIGEESDPTADPAFSEPPSPPSTSQENVPAPASEEVRHV